MLSKLKELVRAIDLESVKLLAEHEALARKNLEKTWRKPGWKKQSTV